MESTQTLQHETFVLPFEILLLHDVDAEEKNCDFESALKHVSGQVTALPDDFVKFIAKNSFIMKDIVLPISSDTEPYFTDQCIYVPFVDKGYAKQGKPTHIRSICGVCTFEFEGTPEAFDRLRWYNFIDYLAELESLGFTALCNIDIAKFSPEECVTSVPEFSAATSEVTIGKLFNG